MRQDWVEGVRTLLEAPSPAVLTTYRQDGSPSAEAELEERDVTADRAEIAGRYLGEAAGARFAEGRRAKPGVLVRLVPSGPRV